MGGVLDSLMGGHTANIAEPDDRDLLLGAGGGETRGALPGDGPERRALHCLQEFAGVAVPVIMAFPRPLIGAVAGLAMISGSG